MGDGEHEGLLARQSSREFSAAESTDSQTPGQWILNRTGSERIERATTTTTTSDDYDPRAAPA